MEDKKYHERQYEHIYRSTEKFVDWLEQLGYLSDEGTQSICDMACGGDCPKTKFGAETTTRCRCQNDINVQDNAVGKFQKGVFGQSGGELMLII